MSVSGPCFRYEQVTADLRRKIVSGQFSPGDQLPPETALADQYGITRQTLRHALEVLEDDGVILRQKGRGTFVAKPDVKTGIGPILYVGDYESHFFREFYYAISLEGQRWGQTVSAFSPVGNADLGRLRERAAQVLDEHGRVICWAGDWAHVAVALPQGASLPVLIHLGEMRGDEKTYHVVVDQWRAVHTATMHLLRQGHRRLAFLGTHPSQAVMHGVVRPIPQSATYEAFQTASRAWGATEIGALGYYTTPTGGAGLPEEIRPNAYCATEDEAERLVRRFVEQLDPGVTAFVCDADFRAVTLCHVLAQMGRRVPDDVSVIGVGNTPWCEALRPKLTSVSLGEQAAARLAVQCTSCPEPTEPVVYYVGPALVARGSTRSV